MSGMTDIPADLRYTKTHEWAKQVGASEVRVGITFKAQQELKDIVFVELPKVGKVVKAGDACAVVESVKAAFDIYAPVSGTIINTNRELETRPQLINQDPYGNGWFFAIEPRSVTAEWGELMSPEVYAKLVTTEI